MEETRKTRLTLLRYLWNGKPLSRARDQTMRDEVAVKPTTAAQPREMVRPVIIDVPACDWVAL